MPLALWLLCFGALTLAALLSGYVTFLMASFAGVAAIFFALGLHIYQHWRLCCFADYFATVVTTCGITIHVNMNISEIRRPK